MKKIVLGWTRDGGGNIVNWHPVEVANSITANKRDNTQNYVMEEQCLTPKRTEYGKAIRKDMEAGKVNVSRKYTQQLEPRTDGVTNTITSVQKDNYIAIPQATKSGMITMQVGGGV